MNETVSLYSMVKELREHKKDANWEREYMNKYESIRKQDKVRVNFRTLGTNNIEHLNIIFKNQFEGLNYDVNSNTSGYYIIINRFEQEKQKIEIGLGTGIIREWYGEGNQERYYELLTETPYKLAVQEIGKEKCIQAGLNPEHSLLNLDMDTLSEQEFNAIISMYKHIIEVYPEVMRKYIEKKQDNFKNEFENYQRNRGKEKGKIFTKYIWELMKEKEGLEPTITNQNMDELGNNNNIETEDDVTINDAQAIKNGRNIIYYGVPGSGKSYTINEKIKSKDYERVVFYEEYSYYDFVGQMVPDKEETLKFAPGPFTRILEKALNNEDKEYYLIIEEMNRGNAESIFGDMLHLLDRDENGEGKYGVFNLLKDKINITNENAKAKMRKKGGIYIPSNLTIYATINNADQNVFNEDSAFGRRWEDEIQFCDVDKSEKNDSNKQYFEDYIKGTNVTWFEFREKINSEMLKRNYEIYNAEEKRMGLYYIESQYLSKNIVREDSNARRMFANKIFRYLWNSVFKNCRQQIFKENEKFSLEELIKDFEKYGEFSRIFNEIEFEEKKEESNE